MRPVVNRIVVVCALISAGCDSKIPRTQDRSGVDEMRFVAGKTFDMGTDESELESIRRKTGLRSTGPMLGETPRHPVTVDDFYMDTFDVTNAQFAQFVDANPQWTRNGLDDARHNGRYLEHWLNDVPPPELHDHPVVFITWASAAAYCHWQDKRLPTEAEYEWASQDPDNGGMYPWGDAPPADDVVSWGGNGIDTTVPVGSYPPNSRGLYDMSGNVWHFTADPWLGSYTDTFAELQNYQAAANDPGVRRVVRGGSWGANAANLRVRYRDSHRPDDAREMVGFRCARDAE